MVHTAYTYGKNSRTTLSNEPSPQSNHVTPYTVHYWCMVLFSATLFIFNNESRIEAFFPTPPGGFWKTFWLKKQNLSTYPYKVRSYKIRNDGLMWTINFYSMNKIYLKCGFPTKWYLMEIQKYHCTVVSSFDKLHSCKMNKVDISLINWLYYWWA